MPTLPTRNDALLQRPGDFGNLDGAVEGVPAEAEKVERRALASHPPSCSIVITPAAQALAPAMQRRKGVLGRSSTDTTAHAFLAHAACNVYLAPHVLPQRYKNAGTGAACCVNTQAKEVQHSVA
jgi:hypothetical protein